MNRLAGRRYQVKNGVRALRRWVVPYMLSRVRAAEFRPLLCYLFTEWRCNIDCHYCFDFNNREPGMTFDTARRSIDWLKSVGCRVVAIMGGEPLLRKQFILDVVDHGAKNGFFVYLPTNGLLLDEKFIDQLGERGVAAINVAVDTVGPTVRELPKNYERISSQMAYLAKRQEKYGFIPFFNINITAKNLGDVRRLTEIAERLHIGTDYHIIEHPYTAGEYYQHRDNELHFREEQFSEVDELLDWLIEKNRNGMPMVNSQAHFADMKRFLRREPIAWPCRAGHNSAFIRADGSLAPCFTLAHLEEEWGRIGEPRFSRERMNELRKACQPNCVSTCQYTLGHYYTITTGILEWTGKHVAMGRERFGRPQAVGNASP